MDTALSFLEKLSKLNLDKNLFYFAVLIVILTFANMIMGTYKGRDPFYILIFDRIKDTSLYLLQEMTGNVVQRINALFAISVFLTFMGFLICFFYEVIIKMFWNTDLLTGIIISIVILCFTMPICTLFTRARY